ncbi:MAG: TonB-dependent receptor [Acidobacteriota bacterium]|nr:TonB-dependent receptor [Acidobacteriota bacterium]
MVGRLRLSLVVFVFSCPFAFPCFGQNGLSRISGTITDASGAVVAGANVTATNEATGVKYTQKTTAAGLYSFPSLPVGAYTVSVETPGFKTSSRTNNVLEVNTPLAIDLTLEVGSAAETVSVAATAEALQTNNATIGDVITQKAIQDLPLNGRNPLTLITLEPGVVQRSAGGAGSGIHVNGSRDRAYNVTIDGIEANESTVPNPVSNLYRLNPDNVEEYKVTTNNATPEEGRNSGASTAIATRSGTNQIHGVAFEFLRNTDLNANDFFANAQGTPKPDIKLHQFGFEVGGPIIKNKTFFFGGWQQQQAKFTQPVDQTLGNIPVVYTPEALAGNFRYFVPDPNNAFVLNGQKITRTVPQLVNGASGALQPGVRNCGSPSDTNCIGSYNIFANDPRRIGLDPKIGALLKSLPHPNVYTNGDGLNTAGYEWNPPTQQNGPAYTARIDHTFNERNNLFVRYLQSTLNTLDGDPLNGRPQVYPGFPPEGEVFRHTKNLAVSYRRVFSPRVVNEFTAGFARFVFLFTQGEANPAFPDVPPYSFNFATSPYTNTPHSARAITTPQFLDNLNIVKGSHVVRTGLNVRFYEHNDQRGQPGGINVTPSLNFSATTRPPTGFTLPTRIDPTDVNNLNGTINELLGIPARLSQVFLGDLKSDTFLPFRTGKSVSLWDQGTRLKQYDFYLQDEWRIRQNLVLNYGARWEINTAPSEAAGRVYVPNNPVDGSQGPVSFVKADRWFQNNNIGAIGPRVGIAWSPRNSQKTVIRAGYGIAFDPVSSFQVTAVAGRVPGLTTSCSATVGVSTTPGCAGVPDIRIGEGFPLELAPPTTKPSSFLTLPAVTLNNAPSLAVFDPNLKLPTVHEWNLTVQHELPGSVVIQAGYIGRRGTRLFRAYDINQINADPILPSFLALQQNNAKGCNPDGTGCPAGVTPQAVPLLAQGIVTSSFVNTSTTKSDLQLNAAGNFAGRIEQTTLSAHLRPNQQFGTITYLDSGGDSYYHSFQFTARKRFSSGLLMGLAYTFGKSIDDQSVDPVGASSGGGLSTTNSRTPTDIRDWRNERARSDFDRTHVLTTNFVYDLPFGRGKSFAANAPRAVNQIIGGWSLNGIYIFMTGEPFSVRSGVRTSNFSHESRADIVGAKPQTGLYEVPPFHGPLEFKDASGFAVPSPGGDGAGRNIFVASNYNNVDLSLGKRFNFTERIHLQFRAEAFNALNHVNFDNPRDASSGSPSIKSSSFAQTCCAAVAPPSTQTVVQTGEAARVIQLGLKLYW